jgi:xanthine/CO dehydrogenase XdhC/CoxF family maturation factor
MTREQPWSDQPLESGRLIVLTRNPISTALTDLAAVIGREVVLIDADTGGAGVQALRDARPTEADAVLICDHDAPDAPPALRLALDGRAGYVAMLASRGRTVRVLDELRADGYGAEALDRLHMPAGLDVGGKRPADIALSVIAEVVAVSHGRIGGPMRAPA